jgi:hypothetical protein
MHKTARQDRARAVEKSIGKIHKKARVSPRIFVTHSNQSRAEQYRNEPCSGKGR